MNSDFMQFDKSDVNHTGNYIEPGIRPVCDVLNSMLGVATVYSCEGHWMRGCAPFVMFDAPNEVALRIHRILDSGGGHGDGSLSFCWRLHASFQDDGALRYILEPFDVRLPPHKPNVFTQWKVWSQMDAELNRLANLLVQIK